MYINIPVVWMEISTFKLEWNYEKKEDDSSLVKMSANWAEKGTWRTRIWPQATRSQTKWMSISMSFVRWLLTRFIDMYTTLMLNNSCFGCWATQLTKQIMDPTCFGDNICYFSIFDLCTRPRNNSLAFGGPRDKVVTNKYIVSGSGAMCRWASPQSTSE